MLDISQIFRTYHQVTATILIPPITIDYRVFRTHHQVTATILIPPITIDYRVFRTHHQVTATILIPPMTIDYRIHMYISMLKGPPVHHNVKGFIL